MYENIDMKKTGILLKETIHSERHTEDFASVMPTADLPVV